MEKAQRTTKYPSLASENFSHGKKHYFIDVKKAANDSHFLLITSSEQYGEGEYHRQTVQLWEEDLGMFVEGLSMVLRRLAHGDLATAEPVMKLVKDVTGMEAMAPEDRPREKLHAFGAGTLSNTELLAILFCTGSSELSVLDLCGQVMLSINDEAAGLRTMTTEQLCAFKGVGAAKAATLLAALELGRRAFISSIS